MVKEHYVPRAYLRQFAPEKEGLISRYSLVEQHGGGGYHSPKDRYSINEAAAAEDFADKWFETDETNRVERETAETIRRIIAKEPLTRDDIAKISQFISFQHSRTPQSKLYHDARKRLGDAVDETPERVPDHFEDDWRDTIHYNANEGHESLQFMGWRVVENETEVPFITSDKPVVHYFEQDFEEVNAVDEDLHGREIFCPLDQNHLLILLDPETFSVDSQWPDIEINRVSVSEPRDIHKFNMLQGVSAFQELFGPVGYGNLLEQTVQVLCDAFPHEDFIRGNREDLETIETAQRLASGMKTQSEVDLYLQKYKPIIDSRRMKSHAIWMFSHDLEIIDALRRNELRDGYWEAVTAGKDPRDL